MAKSNPAAPAYVITSKSPISYSGKRVAPGTVVTDIPGESVTWLLKEGYIKPAPVVAPAPSSEIPPATEPAPEPTPPVEPPAAPTEEPAAPAETPASA
jgi:hypothetical protein